MKLIINCSDIRATGATQVSISFINECLKFHENEYYIFMSQTIGNQIKQEIFPLNFKFYIFQQKPFYFGNGLKSWKKLKKLEKEIAPDCVFSVFGPSIWKPKHPHLIGYAYPYYIYKESPFFNQIGFKLNIKINLLKFFHKFYLERNGRHYVCETQDVRKRLPNYIKCDLNNVYTVTNTFNHYFENFKKNENIFLPQKSLHEFRMVTLSSFATHKNLAILNQVIPELKKQCSNIRFIFVLTVDSVLFEENFNDSTRLNLINLGRINVKDCPQIYAESDAMFLPTLMECFSASYAEAMIMERPILTSNLDFAKTVCGNAALYFDPLNPVEIAEQIILLAKNKDLYVDLVRKGKQRLNSFDNAYTRAEKYLEICKKISKQK
jgi:glycosyltransferase involved in cell wall biosynthesis